MKKYSQHSHQVNHGRSPSSRLSNCPRIHTVHMYLLGHIKELKNQKNIHEECQDFLKQKAHPWPVAARLVRAADSSPWKWKLIWELVTSK